MNIEQLEQHAPQDAPIAGLEHGEQNSVAGEEDPGAAVEQLAETLQDHPQTHSG